VAGNWWWRRHWFDEGVPFWIIWETGKNCKGKVLLTIAHSVCSTWMVVVMGLGSNPRSDRIVGSITQKQKITKVFKLSFWIVISWKWHSFVVSGSQIMVRVHQYGMDWNSVSAFWFVWRSLVWARQVRLIWEPVRDAWVGMPGCLLWSTKLAIFWADVGAITPMAKTVESYGPGWLAYITCK